MRFSLSSSAALRAIPVALLMCLATVGAQAAKPQAAQGEAGCSSQNPQICQREAAAARQAGRGGQLTAPDSQALERNALSRCAVFKTDEGRSDCEARVRNARTSGSVNGGGELLEATTPVRN
ncbi:hypothetical protein G7047_20790 [Diaphorobacter sp. HDW4A]|uniref:hypothetical protein n=1 Tax=Diaphorobacter sp. HDW4A TaxID=2714924 RepID=UPI00140946B6|nr:hypothetical protein [Diaphorobacter sp. HDW4A]QIL82091.1 hypothetical protein G7047_20790 [Diaphorobacter sp. HDW4A]